jgi:hypothetical protein
MFNPELDFFLCVLVRLSENFSYFHKHASKGFIDHGFGGRPMRFPEAIGIKANLLNLVENVTGISRLLQMVKRGILIPAKADGADYGIALFGRLQRLKSQKEEFEGKRGLIFRDSDVENNIRIVDSEIETVQGELAKRAKEAGRRE